MNLVDDVFALDNMMEVLIRLTLTLCEDINSKFKKSKARRAGLADKTSCTYVVPVQKVPSWYVPQP